MLRTVFLSLGCALILAAAPGCTYFRHLGNDASETVHVGLGASLLPGLYARAQIPVFGSSVGYMPRATYVGSDYGYTAIWRQAAAGIVLGGQMVRTHLDANIEQYWDGYLADAYLDQSHYLVLNVVATDKRTSLGKEQIPFTKVEVGAHVLFVGAQVGVDFVEVLDLVAGVFGWDMLGDDDFVPPSGLTPAESQEAQSFRSLEAIEVLEKSPEFDEPERKPLESDPGREREEDSSDADGKAPTAGTEVP